MSKATEAVKLIEQIAADNSHGYQWGGNGPIDFDCSGLINFVWTQVGVPVNKEVRNTTRTMRIYYLKHGFSDVTASANLQNGTGLQTGDVLVNTENHTAMYVGSGKIVQARSNLDGKQGDSSGQEIRKQAYYNYPWNCVLRFKEPIPSENPEATTDASQNESKPVTDGEVLVVEAQASAAVITESFLLEHHHLRLGAGMKGQEHLREEVRALQRDLKCRGFNIGRYGADGKFGSDTKQAVIAFQKSVRLNATGEVDSATCAALYGIKT